MSVRKSDSEPQSVISADDLHLFNEGSHSGLQSKLGAHLVGGDMPGARFAVWAPNASYVTVFGDFNDWDKQSHPLEVRADSGIWEGFVPGVAKGSRYKFHVEAPR